MWWGDWGGGGGGGGEIFLYSIIYHFDYKYFLLKYFNLFVEIHFPHRIYSVLFEIVSVLK